MLGDARRDARRQDLPGLGQRQRRAVHGREAAASSARRPVTLSDSDGYIYDEAGIDREKLAFVMELKNVRRGRIKEYADKYKGARLHAARPGSRTTTRSGTTRRDCAFPSATQNEINGKDAANLLAERRLRGGRRRQHADRRSTAWTQFVDAGHPLRARQGRQRRRRRHLRPGDGAEQHALSAGRARRWTSGCTCIMKSIHQACVETAERFGTPGQLRQRRQHRRLPEGRRRDDGPGAGVRAAVQLPLAASGLSAALGSW